MVPMFKHRQWLCAFIGLFVSLGTARADWPEKQITMVACFAAGGGTDIAARIINTQLGEALGKPVVVENRGGAGGNIAIKAVQALPADGYTILVCSSAYVVNPSLFAQANYDPYRDFIPLMVMGASPNVFVVPEQSPVKSMQEFIEKAKAAGIYENVLLYTGKKVKHYGLTNHKEYFAEGTEAFFYRNDFYPFVRAELKEHDPALHDVLARVWGVTSTPTPASAP